MIPTISPRTFALAGNSTFTVVSKATGNRFTYKVRKPSEDKPHFVSVMTGSDNESDYTFIGTIFDGRAYVPGKRSSIGVDAPSAKGFAWLWNNLVATGTVPAVAEFHHEGKCCACGRKLTVPDSILSGIGPECAKKHAL